MPGGRPACVNAGARACSTIASAVPRASDPMRITTELPVRTTPAASAKTLGRPSNTKPTTPNGALLASTDHPSWVIVRNGSSRRNDERSQPRRPAIMSSTIRSERVRRVVERPAADAAATSRALASRTGAADESSLSRSANPAKNLEICLSVACPSAVNAAAAASTAATATSCSAAGMWSRSPVSATTMRRSPARNEAASSSLTVT